jgi:hypothetical protein
MNKKLIALFSILSLYLSLPLIPANAAVKAGGTCSSAGITSVSSNKTYTCIKSGKKLIWNKGVIVSQNSQVNKSLNPLSDCKITDQRLRKTNPNNVGFPITKQEIPISGITKAVFIPIDFSDAPGIGDPSVRTTAIAEKMKSWLHAVRH